MNNKDKILHFLSERKRNNFNQRDIQKHLLTDLNVDEVRGLLEEIIDFKSNLMCSYTTSSQGRLTV